MQFSAYVRRWMQLYRPRGYGLRLATERDLDFIVDEVIEGARNGHYHESLLYHPYALAFREQLRKVIIGSPMLRETERGVEQIRAKLWVYGREADDKVGYLLVSEKVPGTLGTDIELYKVGVRKDRRREGHGRRLIKMCVACKPLSAKLYARCYPASDVMCSLLQEAGFRVTNTKLSGTRELECDLK